MPLIRHYGIRYTELVEGEHLIDILNSDPKGNGMETKSTDEIKKDGTIKMLMNGNEGNLFITNKRIIFEDLTGKKCHFFFHEDIKETSGRNDSFIWSGFLSVYLLDWKERDIDWSEWIEDYPDDLYSRKEIIEEMEEEVDFLNYTLSCGNDLSEKLNSEFYSNPEERVKLYEQNKEERRIEKELAKAKRHEKLLEFKEAAEIYKALEMDDEVIRVRKKARNKINQTVVQGDYVDDRDTIVKDSVISKSNVGSGGGKSKAEKIKEIRELRDSGDITDEDYEKMKREIIG